jgi:hypothetical protein
VGAILEHPTLLQGLRVRGGYMKADIKEEEISNEDFLLNVLDVPWARFWNRLMEVAKTESPDVEPVGLAEALKVRVITKMPPFQQTVLRPIWKKVFTILKRHPCFKLLGEEVSEGYLHRRLFKNSPPGAKKRLSGDFADATNRLYKIASDIAADETARCLNLCEYERELFRTSLTGSIIRGKKQLRGQLMGSRSSFVILCMINAAVCRWAIELDQNKIYTLKKAPLVINGDDNALSGTDKLYDIWRKTTRLAGLEESIGKTYFADNFVEINSTVFSVREVQPDALTAPLTGGPKLNLQSLKQVPYVNSGLLWGVKRSGVGLSGQSSDNGTVGSKYRSLLRYAPVHLHTALHHAFVRINSKSLSQFKVPWHIPEWLGGLGLIGVIPPSSLDLRIAHRILIHWAEERPATVKGDMTWKTWLLARGRVGKLFATTTEDQGVRDTERLIGLHAIDLLFDSNIELSTLFNALQGVNSSKLALRHNERLWKVTKDIPKPLTEDELAFRRTWDTLRPPMVEADLADELRWLNSIQLTLD